jgi:hypothetical protein
MKYDIFISYRRSDRELVASVVRRLEERGVAVWYDAEIEGGADWRETIVESLTNSDMLAIFFSEECNNSRQLKKELAVADSLGKAVVPILIEDTQPRGAYLYELADRNWIQAFPEPMEKIEELVEHLATLAGKDGLLGTQAAPKVAANDVGPGGAKAAAPSATLAPAPAPPGPEPMRETEQPLTEAVEEFISGAYESKAPPPKVAKAYVGRVSQAGKPIRKLNDILPFKWMDLVVLLPVLAILVIGVLGDTDVDPSNPAVILATASFYVLFLALYGSLVFPVRYYLRRRPMGRAFVKYVISSLILLGLFAGSMLVAIAADPAVIGAEDGEPLFTADVILAAAIGYLIIFSVVAFLIYGVLAGQRAIRSFRSNIRKI